MYYLRRTTSRTKKLANSTKHKKSGGNLALGTHARTHAAAAAAGWACFFWILHAGLGWAGAGLDYPFHERSSLCRCARAEGPDAGATPTYIVVRAASPPRKKVQKPWENRHFGGDGEKRVLRTNCYLALERAQCSVTTYIHDTTQYVRSTYVQRMDDTKWSNMSVVICICHFFPSFFFHFGCPPGGGDDSPPLLWLARSPCPE